MFWKKKPFFIISEKNTLFFFWFSLLIPSLICFGLLCLADMLVMLGGPYPPRWVLFRQTCSLQLPPPACVFLSPTHYCMSACAYVFVQGSISVLLVRCGPHLAFRTSSRPRFSRGIFFFLDQVQMLKSLPRFLIHTLYIRSI